MTFPVRPADRNAVVYFDRYAAYYDQNQYATTRRTFITARHEQMQALVDDVRIPERGRALDAGCGPGNLTMHLAMRQWTVCALDAAPGMLQLAKSRIDAAGYGPAAEFAEGSIEALPYPDAHFDLVCCAGVIEYLPGEGAALREFARVLKPGGLLILPTTSVVAPANLLDRLILPIARTRIVARLTGLQLGAHRLRYDFIPAFRRRLRDAGLQIEEQRYFYLTVPRPLDRLLPSFARRLEQRMAPYLRGPIGVLAEGYVACARKPAR